MLTLIRFLAALGIRLTKKNSSLDVTTSLWGCSIFRTKVRIRLKLSKVTLKKFTTLYSTQSYRTLLPQEVTTKLFEFGKWMETPIQCLSAGERESKIATLKMCVRLPLFRRFLLHFWVVLGMQRLRCGTSATEIICGPWMITAPTFTASLCIQIVPLYYLRVHEIPQLEPSLSMASYNLWKSTSCQQKILTKPS